MNVKFPGMYNENGEEMRWDNANGDRTSDGLEFVLVGEHYADGR